MSNIKSEVDSLLAKSKILSKEPEEEEKMMTNKEEVMGTEALRWTARYIVKSEWGDHPAEGNNGFDPVTQKSYDWSSNHIAPGDTLNPKMPKAYFEKYKKHFKLIEG